MSRSSWRKEQAADPEIGPIVDLLKCSELMQFKTFRECSPGMKILLRSRRDLRLEDGLLYRSWLYKNEVVYLQFVLPSSYRKCTVIACHDQFGHLGMDKTLVLLQERFFWPKMSDDVCTHICHCDRCLRFKQTPEKDEMFTIETSYPMELVHMDFLTIGSKKKGESEKDVLVITDHFTRFAQAFVTHIWVVSHGIDVYASAHY